MSWLLGMCVLGMCGLYTNIPHDLLRTAMAKLFVDCAAHEHVWGVRVVSTPAKDPRGKAVHVAYYQRGCPGDARVSDNQGGSTKKATDEAADHRKLCPPRHLYTVCVTSTHWVCPPARHATGLAPGPNLAIMAWSQH